MIHTFFARLLLITTTLFGFFLHHASTMTDVLIQGKTTWGTAAEQAAQQDKKTSASQEATQAKPTITPTQPSQQPATSQIPHPPTNLPPIPPNLIPASQLPKTSTVPLPEKKPVAQQSLQEQIASAKLRKTSPDEVKKTSNVSLQQQILMEMKTKKLKPVDERTLPPPIKTQTPHESLLQEIRTGKKLKNVSTPPQTPITYVPPDPKTLPPPPKYVPPPPSIVATPHDKLITPNRANLLEEIKGGTTLKKVTPKNQSTNTNQQPHGVDMEQIMRRRRQAIAPEDKGSKTKLPVLPTKPSVTTDVNPQITQQETVGFVPPPPPHVIPTPLHNTQQPQKQPIIPSPIEQKKTPLPGMHNVFEDIKKRGKAKKTNTAGNPPQEQKSSPPQEKPVEEPTGFNLDMITKVQQQQQTGTIDETDTPQSDDSDWN